MTFREHHQTSDIVDDGRRPAGGPAPDRAGGREAAGGPAPDRAGEDAGGKDATGTILRRLLANLRLIAQVYALATARDLRLAVRDIVAAVVVFSTVMMLGLYLIALLVAAAVLALALILPAWAAALIVFGAVAVVTGLLVFAMASRLRRIAVRMRTTIQAAKEDARWFRTRILRID